MYEILINFSLLQCTQMLFSLFFFDMLHWSADWLTSCVCVPNASCVHVLTHFVNVPFLHIHLYVYNLFVCLLPFIPFYFYFYFLPDWTIRCAFKFQYLAAFWHKPRPRSSPCLCPSRVKSRLCTCFVYWPRVLSLRGRLYIEQEILLRYSWRWRCLVLCFVVSLWHFWQLAAVERECVSIVYRFLFCIWFNLTVFMAVLSGICLCKFLYCMENVSPNPTNVLTFAILAS